MDISRSTVRALNLEYAWLVDFSNSQCKMCPPNPYLPCLHSQQKGLGYKLQQGRKGQHQVVQGREIFSKTLLPKPSSYGSRPSQRQAHSANDGILFAYWNCSFISALQEWNKQREFSGVSLRSFVHVYTNKDEEKLVIFFFSPLKSHALFPFKGIFETARTCLTLGSTIFARGNIFWITFAVGYIQNRSSC